MSDHWGLGLAAQLSFGFTKDKPASQLGIGDSNAPTWTTVAPTLAFSATFN